MLAPNPTHFQLNNTKNHITKTRFLSILKSCTIHRRNFWDDASAQRSSLTRWIDTRTKQHEITRSRRFSFRSNSSAKSGNYPSPHKPRPPQLQLPSDHRPRTGVRWGLTGGADPSAREQGTTRAPPPSSCGGGDPTSGRVAGADPAAGRCAVRVPRWRDLCAFFPLFVWFVLLPPGLTRRRPKRRVNEITAVNVTPPRILIASHIFDGVPPSSGISLSYASCPPLSSGITTRKIASCTIWCWNAHRLCNWLHKLHTTRLMRLACGLVRQYESFSFCACPHHKRKRKRL